MLNKIMTAVIAITLILSMHDIANASDITYFNRQAKFHLRIPDGWTEIPKPEIRDYEVKMGVENKYLTGFYTKLSTNNTFPYILIERKHKGKKVTAKDVKQYINKYTDYISKNNPIDNNKNAIIDRLKNEFGLNDIRPFREVVYDAKKNTIYLNLIISTDTDNFIGYMALVFYGEGYLQVLCYAKEQDYVKTLPIFDKFISSISFEKNKSR